MMPSGEGYNLKRKSIQIGELRELINDHFEDNEPEDIRYYHVIHDELMDIMDKEFEHA